MDAIVGDYNRSGERERRRLRDELADWLHHEGRAARERNRLLRPLLDLRWAIEDRLAEARARLAPAAGQVAAGLRPDERRLGHAT